MRVALAAAKRLIEYMGMGTSVWGHASARSPVDPSKCVYLSFADVTGPDMTNAARCRIDDVKDACNLSSCKSVAALVLALGPGHIAPA